MYAYGYESDKLIYDRCALSDGRHDSAELDAHTRAFRQIPSRRPLEMMKSDVQERPFHATPTRCPQKNMHSKQVAYPGNLNRAENLLRFGCVSGTRWQMSHTVSTYARMILRRNTDLG